MIRFVLAIAAMLLSGMVSAEYHVVVASFANEIAAARAASADKNKAFTILAVRLESGEMSYRLVSGPFQTADSAAQERSRLISAGFPGSWIVGDAATVAAPIKPISSTSNESPPPVFARRSLPSDLDRGIVGVTNAQAFSTIQK